MSEILRDSSYEHCAAVNEINEDKPDLDYLDLSESTYDKIPDQHFDGQHCAESERSLNEYMTPSDFQDYNLKDSLQYEKPIKVVRPLSHLQPQRQQDNYVPELFKRTTQNFEVETKVLSSKPQHSKRSKRPCIVGVMLILTILIASGIATFMVFYFKGEDSPNIEPYTLSLNRCHLRKINGTEIFSDCKDIKLFGNDSDGLYTIYPDPLTETPVVVYCDMTTDGGGWTVFQHRRDRSVNFYRLWNSYKNGFGEASGEHWIGNDNLHKLTTLGMSDLYVRLETFSGDWYYAKYDDFNVADESDGYRLRLKVGSYKGNAGDGMDSHDSTNPNGLKFSTPDRDNDNAPAQCTFARRGAWWYNMCTLTNLNGIYGNGDCLTSETCNFWYLLNTSFVGVKTSFMMVRRSEYKFYCALCPSSK